MKPRAVIAGATGLTGRALLAEMARRDCYSEVTALARHRVNDLTDCRQLVCAFDALPALPPADHAFCCLGTTIKTAGSRAAFRKVDFDYVINFAHAAKQAGAQQFHVISALGAHASSTVFYSQTKGQMEDAVAAINFDAVHIYRPSLLLGDRQETRAGERIGIGIASLLSPLLVGPARKYKPVAVNTLANAMLNTAQQPTAGVCVHESNTIEALAKR